MFIRDTFSVPQSHFRIFHSAASLKSVNNEISSMDCDDFIDSIDSTPYTNSQFMVFGARLDFIRRLHLEIMFPRMRPAPNESKSVFNH